MGMDTTKASYWLNWKFLVCALYVVAALVVTLIVIRKYERKAGVNDEQVQGQQVPVGVLYKEEAWKTCLKGLHPGWLLSFRIVAFVTLLALMISNAISDGPGAFFFNTQWTFLLTTIFFGLASAFSIYGCWYYERGCFHGEERGLYSPELGGTKTTCLLQNNSSREEVHAHQLAGFMVYLLQIIYQVSAGAVVLTDVVWWALIYPFLTGKDYRLNFFDACLHSVNSLILVDTIVNDMRFPMFRIVYFITWTILFVICQWIIHACVSMPWPYPFMDLSTPYAPAWYAGVGLFHFPCFGLFAFIVKLKYLWLPEPLHNPA